MDTGSLVEADSSINPRYWSRSLPLEAADSICGDMERSCWWCFQRIGVVGSFCDPLVLIVLEGVCLLGLELLSQKVSI